MTGPPEGCRELMGLASLCAGEALSTRERTQRPQDPRGWGEQRHLCTPECAPCGSSWSQGRAPPAGAAEVTRRGCVLGKADVRSWSVLGSVWCPVSVCTLPGLWCRTFQWVFFYRKGCVPWQGRCCLGRGSLPSLFLPNLCHSWAAFRRVMSGYRGRGQACAWWCLLPETTST